MSLSIATVNVNGIRAAVKRRNERNPGMLAWLRSTGADVVLLQEVRATADQARAALAPALDEGWHLYDAENHQAKGRAGVAILSRTPLTGVTVGFDDGEFADAGRYLAATVPAADSGLGEEVRVASLYLPSGAALSGKQDEKYRFLDAFGAHLAELGAREGLHAVIGGDWNICHREQDLRNWRTNRRKSGFLPQERAWMNSVFGTWPDESAQPSLAEASEREIADGAFSDGTAWTPPEPAADPAWFDVARRLHPEAEGPFSWWTYRGRAFDTDAGWRIDYQAATAPMLARAVSAHVDRPEAYDERWTDHAPVVAVYE